MQYLPDYEIDDILYSIEEVLEKRINPDEMELIQDLKMEFNEEIMKSIRRVVGYHRESKKIDYDAVE